MGSHLFLSELPSDHEPENRKCLEINGTVFRFMGRSLPAATLLRAAAAYPSSCFLAFAPPKSLFNKFMTFQPVVAV